MEKWITDLLFNPSCTSKTETPYEDNNAGVLSATILYDHLQLFIDIEKENILPLFENGLAF